MDDFETVRSLYDAWHRNDQAAVLALQHPDVVWETSGAFPGMDRRYRGHDGVRKYWSDIREPFDPFVIEVKRLERRGEVIVVHVLFHAVGAESGAQVELDVRHEWTIVDGLVVSYRAFRAD